MKKIVITGGIASGKSEIRQLASDAGFSVIDADQIARKVVKPGSIGWQRIVDVFGPNFIGSDGEIHRPKLREFIAKNDRAQKQIGELLHPLIRQEIEMELTRFEKEGQLSGWVEAALAIESGSYRYYDLVLLVSAPENIRMTRLLRRDGMNRNSAEALIRKQMPDEAKRTYAHFEIENDGDRENLKQQFLSFIKTFGLQARTGFGPLFQKKN